MQRTSRIVSYEFLWLPQGSYLLCKGQQQSPCTFRQTKQAVQMYVPTMPHSQTPNHTCACTSLGLDLPLALALCCSFPWSLQCQVAGLQPSDVVNAAAECSQLLSCCHGAVAGAGAAAGPCDDAIRGLQSQINGAGGSARLLWACRFGREAVKTLVSICCAEVLALPRASAQSRQQ